ncbi:unnamed protein product [Effrenium voratum]|nr:unnamed protein product [Effrenium voratum]
MAGVEQGCSDGLLQPCEPVTGACLPSGKPRWLRRSSLVRRMSDFDIAPDKLDWQRIRLREERRVEANIKQILAKRTTVPMWVDSLRSTVRRRRKRSNARHMAVIRVRDLPTLHGNLMQEHWPASPGAPRKPFVRSVIQTPEGPTTPTKVSSPPSKVNSCEGHAGTWPGAAKPSTARTPRPGGEAMVRAAYGKPTASPSPTPPPTEPTAHRPAHAFRRPAPAPERAQKPSEVPQAAPGPTLADLVAEAEEASEVPAQHEATGREEEEAKEEATAREEEEVENEEATAREEATEAAVDDEEATARVDDEEATAREEEEVENEEATAREESAEAAVDDEEATAREEAEVDDEEATAREEEEVEKEEATARAEEEVEKEEGAAMEEEEVENEDECGREEAFVREGAVKNSREGRHLPLDELSTCAGSPVSPETLAGSPVHEEPVHDESSEEGEEADLLEEDLPSESSQMAADQAADLASELVGQVSLCE